MTCDVARNRLLALPDPLRPTDDLLPHLAECAACRAVQADAARLDRLLTRLPVPSGPGPEVAATPRSELLAKMVKHNTELATTARTPDKRLGVYAEFSADLKAEACGVYKVAKRDDMNSLASQYEKMVADGVVS